MKSNSKSGKLARSAKTTGSKSARPGRIGKVRGPVHTGGEALRTAMAKSGRRVIVDVDARGRVSVARFGFKSTQLVVDELPDGGLVLHQAVALTPTEAAHYLNPKAVAALDQALAELDSGEVRKVTLRSQR
ncbi:MAG: hypothetical protein ACRDWX_06235 [Acidimicrobiia bacterium]